MRSPAWHVSFATFVASAVAEEAVPLTRMEVGTAYGQSGKESLAEQIELKAPCGEPTPSPYQAPQ